MSDTQLLTPAALILASIHEHAASIQKIAEQYGMSNLRLFGSVARGDAHIDSDLDLLVDPDPARKVMLRDLSGFSGALSDLLGREVDVVIAANLKTRIRDKVIAQAQPLFSVQPGAYTVTKDQRLYLDDILKSALQITEFVEVDSKSDRAIYLESKLLQRAIFAEFVIMGEAASKVSKETRERFPDIGWRDLINMRNRLIHGYDDLNLDTIWDTAANDVPKLIPLVEAAMKVFDEEES